MANPTRALLFVNSLKGFRGGVERYVADTAMALRAAGYRVVGLFEQPADNAAQLDEVFDATHLWDASAPDAAIDRIRREGVRVAFVHKIASRTLMDHVLGAFSTMAFVHDHDYHCLRHHKYFPIAARNCRLPAGLIRCSLCSGLVERHDGSLRLINPVERLHALRQLRSGVRVLVASRFMRDVLVSNGVAASRMSILHPFAGVLPQTARPAAHGGPSRILFVGQIIRGKGLDLLLRAMRLVRGDCVLHVVGKGNGELKARALAARCGLGDRVVFEGWHDSTSRFYSRADIAAVPSRWQEPFGLVGIEALAHGCPVVGFDVGGIGEWLHDGVNGVLVKPGDIRGLAGAIDTLIASPERRAAMGAHGRSLVEEQFTTGSFVRRFTEEYDRLAAE